MAAVVAICAAAGKEVGRAGKEPKHTVSVVEAVLGLVLVTWWAWLFLVQLEAMHRREAYGAHDREREREPSGIEMAYACRSNPQT